MYEELSISYLSNIQMTELTGFVPVEYSINLLTSIPSDFDFSTVYRYAKDNIEIVVICNESSPFNLNYFVMGV